MEQLDVFDCLNVLIASYFTDDRGCAHENREHTGKENRSASGRLRFHAA